MTDMVIINKEKLFTTTLIIADGCKVEHRSVYRLLRKHSNTEILTAFKIAKVSQGGRPVEYAELDELQTTFLITLMRNSEVVIKFKGDLTKEFYRQRQIISKLIAQRDDSNWQHVRKDGKQVYFQKTNVIKDFVEYATDQGSKNAKMYYANLAKMENKALFLIEQKYPNLREVLTVIQLMQVATADNVIEKALNDGMNDNINYKECYKLAKNRLINYAKIIGQSPVLSLAVMGE